MLYEQRTARAEEEFVPTARPWLHDADDADRRRIAESCAWWYVVVDEVVGDWVKLVFAPWPTLDVMGRLTFSKMGKSIWLDVTEVRDRADQTRPLSRPMRISDVFAILASKGPSKVPEWSDIADITPDARESAKVAAFATRGDLLAPETVDQLAATAEPGQPKADKAVQQSAANSELPGTTAGAAI